MKILRIYTRLPPLIGGMENHIAQLTKEQIKLGHDVVIYFNKGDKVSSHDVQVTKYSLYKLKPQFLGFFLFHFLVLIRLLSSQNKFELIHIHGDWSSLVFSKLIKDIASPQRCYFLVFSRHMHSSPIQLVSFQEKTFHPQYLFIKNFKCSTHSLLLKLPNLILYVFSRLINLLD